jgi:hypothetical protein
MLIQTEREDLSTGPTTTFPRPSRTRREWMFQGDKTKKVKMSKFMERMVLQLRSGRLFTKIRPKISRLKDLPMTME